MRAGRHAAALLVALVGCLGAVAYAATPRQAARPATDRSGSPAEALAKPRLRRHPGRVEASAAATFGFRAKGGPRFECRLDSRAWTSCRSPVAFSGLSAGTHRFSVRAVGRRGSHGPASRFRWRVLDPRDFAIAPRLSGLGALFPGGAPQALPLTISNPNPVAIFVTSLTVATTGDHGGCRGADNLALAPAGVSPSAPLRVPPHSSVDLPAAGVAAPSIQLRELSVNQDACQGATFPLAFSGSARG
jgi:hypothetical protein